MTEMERKRQIASIGLGYISYLCGVKELIQREVMKYPIGIQSFAQLREDGFVYVDKTALIHQLVTEGKSISSAVPAVSARACWCPR